MQLLWLMLATSLQWKTGNESGCYQPLQHLVTPVRWHRARLFPASPVMGSQQRCERECVCTHYARLILNRRKKEIGRKRTGMGEQKDKQRRDSIRISHAKRLLKISLKSAAALVASHSAALRRSKHVRDHDCLPRTPSHMVVGVSLLQGPEIPGDCETVSTAFYLLPLINTSSGPFTVRSFLYTDCQPRATDGMSVSINYVHQWFTKHQFWSASFQLHSLLI